MNFSTALTFVSIFISIHLTVSNSSCAWVSVNECFITVSCDTDKAFEISNKDFYNCSDASIFWSYPVSNMTIIFRYDQNSSSPFNFCLTDLKSIYDDILLYRITDGKESKIDKIQHKICFDSDKNNSFGLKLVGPSSIYYYGVFIRYTLERTNKC
jgi:hypothetical protein